MIAFCCATTDDESFRAGAAASMQATIEGDSLLVRRHRPETLGSALNEMMAEAAACDDLEATVVLEQSVTIRDNAFLCRVRQLIRQGVDVAAVGIPPMAGLVSQNGDEMPDVDGTVLLLGVRAVRELRFDSSLSTSFLAQAAHICAQASARDMAVVVSGTEVRSSRPGLSDGL